MEPLLDLPPQIAPELPLVVHIIDPDENHDDDRAVREVDDPPDWFDSFLLKHPWVGTRDVHHHAPDLVQVRIVGDPYLHVNPETPVRAHIVDDLAVRQFLVRHDDDIVRFPPVQLRAPQPDFPEACEEEGDVVPKGLHREDEARDYDDGTAHFLQRRDEAVAQVRLSPLRDLFPVVEEHIPN